MSEPFLAEVKMFGFTFAPRGWATCDGQLLPINQYQSLYSLMGTTYGGDGRTSFGLPDLRGRAPAHPDGSAIRHGTKTGVETVTLATAQTPAHSHTVRVSADAATSGDPGGHVLAVGGGDVYGDKIGNGAMAAGAIANTGGSQIHDNMQPWLALTFCIALQGLFPSRD